jgi:hypothetical protein
MIRALRRAALSAMTMLAILCPVAQAALNSAIVWEVRTSGSNTNGCGFKAGASGTDWTQQDAAQYSVTDAVTNGTTTITSATANFGTDVVGNVLYITGGTASITADRYEITSRTNSTTIIVDRSSGLTTGTGATLKIGGACDDPEEVSGDIVAGNTCYVKAGTYTVTFSAGTSGSDNNWIKWYGYNATRGDNPTGSNRPKFDCNGGASANAWSHDGSYNVFRNFWVDDCTDDGIRDSSGVLYWNVRSSNHGNEGLDDLYANSSTNYLYQCEFDGNAAAGVYRSSQTNNGTVAVASNFHNNGGRGLGAGGNNGSPTWGSIFAENAGPGNGGAGVFNIGNVYYGNTGASNSGLEGITANEFVINSFAGNNGQYGFNCASGHFYVFDYNGYNGNTTAGVLNCPTSNAQTGAPSFTDAANLDFTVTSSSSSLVGTGWPQSLTDIGAVGDYQANIGLDQDDNASGGGGTDLLGVFQ